MNGLEQAAFSAWRSWGATWALFTRCAFCGEVTQCRGRSRQRMCCLGCFDQGRVK